MAFEWNHVLHFLPVDELDHVVLQLRHVLRLGVRFRLQPPVSEGHLEGLVGGLPPLADVVGDKLRVFGEMVLVALLGHFQFALPLLDIALVLLYFLLALAPHQLR